MKFYNIKRNLQDLNNHGYSFKAVKTPKILRKDIDLRSYNTQGCDQRQLDYINFLIQNGIYQPCAIIQVYKQNRFIARYTYMEKYQQGMFVYYQHVANDKIKSNQYIKIKHLLQCYKFCHNYMINKQDDYFNLNQYRMTDFQIKINLNNYNSGQIDKVLTLQNQDHIQYLNYQPLKRLQFGPNMYRVFNLNEFVMDQYTDLNNIQRSYFDQNLTLYSMGKRISTFNQVSGEFFINQFKRVMETELRRYEQESNEQIQMRTQIFSTLNCHNLTYGYHNGNLYLNGTKPKHQKLRLNYQTDIFQMNDLQQKDNFENNNNFNQLLHNNIIDQVLQQDFPQLIKPQQPQIKDMFDIADEEILQFYDPAFDDQCDLGDEDEEFEIEEFNQYSNSYKIISELFQPNFDAILRDIYTLRDQSNTQIQDRFIQQNYQRSIQAFKVYYIDNRNNNKTINTLQQFNQEQINPQVLIDLSNDYQNYMNQQQILPIAKEIDKMRDQFREEFNVDNNDYEINNNVSQLSSHLFVNMFDFFTYIRQMDKRQYLDIQNTTQIDTTFTYQNGEFLQGIYYNLQYETITDINNIVVDLEGNVYLKINNYPHQVQGFQVICKDVVWGNAIDKQIDVIQLRIKQIEVGEIDELIMIEYEELNEQLVNLKKQKLTNQIRRN